MRIKTWDTPKLAHKTKRNKRTSRIHREKERGVGFLKSFGFIEVDDHSTFKFYVYVVCYVWYL